MFIKIINVDKIINPLTKNFSKRCKRLLHLLDYTRLCRARQRPRHDARARKAAASPRGPQQAGGSQGRGFAAANYSRHCQIKVSFSYCPYAQKWNSPTQPVPIFTVASIQLYTVPNFGLLHRDADVALSFKIGYIILPFCKKTGSCNF